MQDIFKTAYFKPERPGIFIEKNSCRFAVEFETGNFEDCGLLLYDENGKEIKIPVSEEGRRGTLCGFEVIGEGIEKCTYLYYSGDETFTDPYARGVIGLEKWGDFSAQPRVIKGRIIRDDFDWGEDNPLNIPYRDTIIYGLNVRAFTMHKSSGVKQKGTFEGIVEKIPYLKNLGITCVELMPSYEYEECMVPRMTIKTMQEAETGCMNSLKKAEGKLNCWGFQSGYYFAPKASYSVQKPEIAFKKMVKELHKNGIEVMMHFYFPPEIKHGYILEVLKYWIMEYHLDGVRLSGVNLPYQLIIQEPVLKETKLRCEYFPVKEIYGEEIPIYRNLLIANSNFKADMRRFLKGDENLVNQVIGYQKANPQAYAVVNAMTDYDGFSLYDCVAYERKHNEENGEENRDGTDYNFTWNCGIEGESRKKTIVELRTRQIKNALAFIFLAQGVPFIFSGDEFGNSRMGNNNAYCQDNETGWVKWKENQVSKELLDYTKMLISLRKEHPVLHQAEECRIMDTLGCGYPDISYHGSEAWRPDLSYVSHMIGIMLCGKYVNEKEDDSFYLAYNMHWQDHELALPHLPKGMKWKRVLTTIEGKEESSADNLITAKGRSVSVYCSEADKDYQEKKHKNSRKDDKKNESVETL